MSYPAYKFISDKDTDNKGRKISDIWSFTFDQIETMHDYIQWLFPLKEPSRYNSNAPILCEEEAQLISKDAKCKINLTHSTDLMLKYYESTNEWASHYNHNLLRITRIIKSCSILIGIEFAAAVYNRICKRCLEIGFEPSSETMHYWQNAVTGL